MEIIARIHNGFSCKFGIPRQSGIIEELCSFIVFEKKYRDPEAFKGLEGFTYIWLLWEFSEAQRNGYIPVVRPPILGGERTMGVFATRSPFRPNSIGLSSVKLKSIEYKKNLEFNGKKYVPPILTVLGADLMDGTPIYDIKPYLPYTDSHPTALGGFTDTNTYKLLKPNQCDKEIQHLHAITTDEAEFNTILKILCNDPRPHYQNDINRIYSFEYNNINIKFTTDGDTFTLVSVEKLTQS